MCRSERMDMPVEALLLIADGADQVGLNRAMLRMEEKVSEEENLA